MSISVKCPHCRHTIKAASQFAGKTASCPNCKGVLSIPRAAAVPPPPPPKQAAPPVVQQERPAVTTTAGQILGKSNAPINRNKVAFFIAIGSGVVLSVLTCCGSIFLAGDEDDFADEDQSAASSTVKGSLKGKSMRDIERGLMGRTPNEVIKLIGRPSDVARFSGLEDWHYERLATDPVTGKKLDAVVVIENIVTEVRWY